MNKIPFNSPHLTGKEIEYIIDAHQTGQLAGDGKYTKIASRLIEKLINVNQSLITHSCTAALEMSAILLDLKPGDEVIMPSYTFVSTANAFVLRGAIPVFVLLNRDCADDDNPCFGKSISGQSILSVKPCISKEDQ